MPTRRRPLRGSHGYSPRRRAKRPFALLTSWPDLDGPPRLQGFAGYKAGMTHAFVVDYRPTSTTSGQEVQVPVTVVEVPPMRVAAVRTYTRGIGGLQVSSEVWASKLEKHLERRTPVPEKGASASELEASKAKATEGLEEVRVLVYTQPDLVSGIPKKRPELMEVRVGGGTLQERLEYAYELLGKEIKITEFTTEGKMVDVAAVTKGRGFQGVRRRWGTKLLSHKNSKHRRMIGTLGTKRPNYVRPSVPQAGQVGYHQRTEFNKRILKIGEKGEEITPKGGFLHYGIVRNPYVVLHGSVPGPAKRLVRLRDPVRGGFVRLEKPPELTYISLASKQGA